MKTMRRTSIFMAALLGLTLLQALRSQAEAITPKTIIIPAEASFSERLAAREIRRYAYLRTGILLPIENAQAPAPDAIVVARKDRVICGRLAARTAQEPAVSKLAPQEYWLATMPAAKGTALLVTGGDDAAVLYAAYRLAELLGVRFYLHGDVLPDDQIRLRIPDLNERRAPLFALRGIQPFHDFPEGPDWWNRDDYLSILSQLPKLRMNFFGLHTYPDQRPNAEPTVWIGTSSDIGEGAKVKFSYPSSYQNTLRGNWGYANKNTSLYSCGADQLFERDNFAPDVMGDSVPEPVSPESCNDVFEKTGLLLHDAFTHAREVGVKTCIGTETPLIIPRAVREHLKAQGKNPDDLAVVGDLYRGMFRRIAQTHPLDYFWFWTPEGWTWEGTKMEQVIATTNDLMAAISAAHDTHAPFALATCGWVLGPEQDRALFDKFLPKNVPVSCINRQVGNTPVEKGFANVQGRGKWAIPWMEDDPGLTAPQLWAGRMRRDARDALAYGCDGLMGIHWRTRVLGPAVSCLAQAAWDQSAWSNAAPAAPFSEGPLGGQIAPFPGQTFDGADENAVYQTVRYNVPGYVVKVPNGSYTVTLKFCEPHYRAAGKRVFDVLLQNEAVITNLDIFARVGGSRALDYTFKNVPVTNGVLRIGFENRIEFPSIAGFVIEAPGFRKAVNCGGPAVGQYQADWTSSVIANSFPPIDDFYRDWALHQFGSEIAESAAAIFARIDGNLPRPADWTDGPGGIKPDPRAWDEVSKQYTFVSDFEALASKVTGAGNRERYDYWLNTFQYMRSMAEVNCLWAKYIGVISHVRTATNNRKELAQSEALPVRIQLVALTEQVYHHLLSLVSNPGELGTVMNWERSLPGLLLKPGEELAGILGAPLPPEANLSPIYTGPDRLILPCARTGVAAGESMHLKAIVLSHDPAREVALQWRPLGHGAYQKIPFKHIARGVYEVELPPATGDFEYYVTASCKQELVFPATAPNHSQTVVIW